MRPVGDVGAMRRVIDRLERAEMGKADSVMLVVAMLLAAVSAISPWLKWRQEVDFFGVDVVHTDNTNLASGLLPPMSCFPEYGGVTAECVGATARDGRMGRLIGSGAQVVVAGIWASGSWLVTRRGALLSKYLWGFLFLPVMGIVLGLGALNAWITDRVILEAAENLPHLVALDWRGPVLLAGGAVLWGVVVWRLIGTGAEAGGGDKDRV